LPCRALRSTIVLPLFDSTIQVWPETSTVSPSLCATAPAVIAITATAATLTALKIELSIAAPFVKKVKNVIVRKPKNISKRSK
jgi:hypothetical protein